MRESYSNSFKTINNLDETLIYTAANDDLVHSLFLCNKTTGDRKISLKLKIGSTEIYLLNQVTLPASTTYSIEKTINLKPGDQIWASCDLANSIDVSVGVLYLVPVINEIYTNSSCNLNNNPQLIYTCPLNRVANIHSFFVCNRSNINKSKVNLWVETETSDIFYLLKDTEIYPSLNITWNKPVNLISGQSIYGSITGTISSDVFLSILELST